MQSRMITNLGLLAALTILLSSFAVHRSSGASDQPTRPLFRTRSSAASNSRQQTQPQPQPQPQTGTGTGTAVEVPAAPVNKPPLQPSIAASAGSIQAPASAVAANRTVRTAAAADIFQNGDGYNIFVTNTCERESMRVNIKTSRPFYGVIHTRNQRAKQICSAEGNGDTEYNLEISHVLNQQDPNYCGVVKARRESVESKDTLSVVVAVRVHRNIELSDDKFFLLNCTNRCQKADCSSPSAKLIETEGETERDTSSGDSSSSSRKQSPEDECTIWKFPWAITLLWCMGILLLAMLISHCILCSSFVCRKVKTEIEEREPSVYEGATDYDDDELYNKRHPYRIDYDNKDIYRTSNNYDPYKLKETEVKTTTTSSRQRSKYPK